MAPMLIDRVHPSAVIGPEVDLGPGVEIGPFAVLEGPVRIGADCRIGAFACLCGPLTMGHRNAVGRRAVLGKSPQSRGYRGEATALKIGDRNDFGDYTTVHRGTVEGGGLTAIGDDNRLKPWAHLGHDVWVGDGCMIGRQALVAGHVQLGDGCQLAGHTVLQQRVRIGRLARLVGAGGSTKDVPPFLTQQGYNCVTGLNDDGLARAGVATEAGAAHPSAYRLHYREGVVQKEALNRILAEFGAIAEINELVGFIRGSTLGINAARGAERRRWCA